MIELDFRLPLSRFSLDVRCILREKVTAIVGESGAGKTSLIESIAGLRRAVGPVVIDGTDISHLPPEQRKIGYVPQDVALFPHMLVRGNLLYGRHPGVSPDLDRVVGMLEIDALLDRRVTELSGGERQRVALGRALMSGPSLLLLDEPLASLDRARKLEILPYLARLRDEAKVPMIYVSHQAGEIQRLCSQVVRIEDGRVAESGGLELLNADATH